MSNNLTPKAGSWVLAAIAAVYGGMSVRAASDTNGAPDTATAPALKAGAEVHAKAPVRFEGTELHIGDLPPVTFHGFGSQGFIASEKYNYLGNSKKGSFEFSEFGLNASVSPFARTRVSAQAFAFDVGNVGRYNVALDYATVDYNFSDKIGIRAGRVRRPEGIYNSIQDIDLARTSVLLPQGMYDARYRDFSASVDGGSLYGNIGLGKAGGLSYEVYGGMVNLSEQGGVARLLQDSLRLPPTAYREVGGFPQGGMQLWWTTPLDGLRAGVALTEAFGFSYDYDLNVPPAFGGGTYHNVVDAPSQHYSLEYQWKSWTFQSEYKYQDYYVQNEVGGNTVSRSHSANDTWYLGAAYRVNKWLEVGSYYTEHHASTSNRDGAGTAVPSDAFQKDLALSLRFDPKPWWLVKLELHHINGTALLHDQEHNPTRTDEGWWMVAVKTTLSF